MTHKFTDTTVKNGPRFIGEVRERLHDAIHNSRRSLAPALIQSRPTPVGEIVPSLQLKIYI